MELQEIKELTYHFSIDGTQNYDVVLWIGDIGAAGRLQ
jgi:hypothetical protein